MRLAWSHLLLHAVVCENFIEKKCFDVINFTVAVNHKTLLFHILTTLHFSCSKYSPWINARCLVVLLVWPNPTCSRSDLALIKWRLINTCTGLVAYHLWSISTLHTKVWPCHARLALLCSWISLMIINNREGKWHTGHEVTTETVQC